MGNTCGGVA